jgi:endonuclease YncB( thermonuclease family)
MVKGRRVMILAADTARRRDSAFAAFVLYDKKLVNLELLREGYAAIDINAHHPYETQFGAAQSTARQHRIGAWSNRRARTVRCSHTEPDGTRCNEMVTSSNGRCFKH